MKYYTAAYRYCCNPFGALGHQNPVKGTITLQLQMCKDVEEENYDYTLIPGQKICCNCHSTVSTNLRADKFCSDPFNIHRQPTDQDVVRLDSEICQKYLDLCKGILISGKRVCSRCYRKIQFDISCHEIPDETSPSTDQLETVKITTETSESVETNTQNSSEYCTNSQNQRNLDSILEVFDIPPVKRQKLTDDRARNRAVDVIQTVVTKISTTVSKSFKVQVPNFENLHQLQEDSNSLKKIISNLQQKYINESKKSKKITLLTLLPDDWPFQTVVQLFDCSRYMWQTASRLKETSGMCNI